MFSQALRRFLAAESAGGIVLAIAAALALVVSNSPWHSAYEELRDQVLTIGWVGGPGLTEPVHAWVNDLLMAVFFFLVGLEIKREFLAGELADRSQATLPAVAALAGMVLPAGIYALATAGDPVAQRGWAIPSATDIAFALGVARLLGPRVPASLKIFLTAVAIIDDLGAILVIALFYAGTLSLPMLGAAALCLAVLWGLNRARVGRLWAYALVGLVMWVFVLKSGVHATLAGVLTALMVPLQDRRGASPLEAAEHALHPWVAFGILPLFAFVNAGVPLQGVSLTALILPVPLGIALGLVVGKTVGILGSLWALEASGWARRPSGASWRQCLGVALLCGIGFTMSLFIGGLAFDGHGPQWVVQLKLGVLAGSLSAGLLGAGVLWGASGRPPTSD
jgi:Na+:H+ antiporter, NhaA family